MIIIIDGYNVLKYRYHSATISEKQRADFIFFLSNYARSKNFSLYLVFDGGPHSYTTSSCIHGLTVFYAGYTVTADDLIVSLLLKQSPENTLVVSNDNEIIKRADALNIATIDGALFCAIVKKSNESKKVAGSPKDSSIKKMPGYESSVEIDELMMQTGTPTIKNDEQRNKKISSKHKDSLREKKLKRLVRKL